MTVRERSYAANPLGGIREFRAGCVECGRTVPLPAYRCPSCAAPLLLTMEPPSSPGGADDRSGLWRHRQLLPLTRHALTLGEANTPLLSLDRPGHASYWLKAEHLNPTLSFKDRAMALGVSFALDRGLPGLVLASTGNAAVSASAYAAAAELPCRIVCGSASGARTKPDICRAYGAEVTVVDGDYSAAYATAVEAENDGWLNVTTTYRNPLLAEAYRSVSVEIAGELGRVPDVVVVPVGAGPLLYGIECGFRDLVELGVADRTPRLVGVQALACAPLVEAWQAADWSVSLAAPTTMSATAATAIADPLRGYEREGLITLETAQASGGALVGVSESALSAAHRSLVRAGHLVEVTSAATLAALDEPELADFISDADDVVLVLTGHGAKEEAPCR